MLNSKRNAQRNGHKFCHRCVGCEDFLPNRTIRAREKRSWKREAREEVNQ